MHPRFCIASACAKSDVGKENSGSMWILMNPHGLHRPTMFHIVQYICHVLYAVLWSCMTVFLKNCFMGYGMIKTILLTCKPAFSSTLSMQGDAKHQGATPICLHRHQDQDRFGLHSENDLVSWRPALWISLDHFGMGPLLVMLMILSHHRRPRVWTTTWHKNSQALMVSNNEFCHQHHVDRINRIEQRNKMQLFDQLNASLQQRQH